MMRTLIYLPTALAVCLTFAVAVVAEPQRAAPRESYQEACVAMTAELALFKSGVLTTPEQIHACGQRVRYHLDVLEKFKP